MDKFKKEHVTALQINRPVILIPIYIAASLLGLVALAQLPGLIYKFIPPYEVTSAVLDEPPTDSHLRVRYEVHRRRICQTDLDRFVRTVPEGIVVWRDRVPGGAVSVGESSVVNEIYLPRRLDLGNYQLSTIVFSTCPEGQHVFESPPINFTLQ